MSQERIEALTKAITQLGATRVAELIYMLDDRYGIDGQLDDLVRHINTEASEVKHEQAI